ncbi:MAG: outer membrane beta-barrel family protein [Niabella sp.]
MKKVTLIITACILFSHMSFGQVKLIGKIVDSISVPINYATINLIKDTNTLKTTTSDSIGNFLIADILPGVYKLQISHVDVNPLNYNINLINDTIIFLKLTGSKENQLEEVVVTSKIPIFERKIDRLVFNVESSIASQGTDALETLRITPQIKIDGNNKLSIVGKSGVGVMINGKILNLSGTDLANYLKSIRSESISKIEIITTPPARYEAQGNSGLINIILKKNVTTGWNGYISSSMSQATYFSNAEVASISYNTEKILYSLTLQYNNTLTKAQEDYSILGTSSSISSDIRKDQYKANGLNLNFQYDLTSRSDIGFIYNYGHSNSSKKINNSTSYLYADASTDQLLTYSNYRAKTPFHTLNAYFDSKLDTSGQNKLSLGLNYYSNVPNTIVNFNTRSESNMSNEIVKTASDVNFKIWSAQADWSLEKNWASIESGVKFSNFKNLSDLRYSNLIDNAYVIDSSRINLFDYNENNYALYVSVEKDISSKWSGKAGLRYEYSDIEGVSKYTNQKNTYNYGKLFPSAYLEYKLDSKNDFSITYSKRIERPSFRALDPFKWYTNPYTYTSGNPELQPSYTHNVELSYLFNNVFVATLYYQKLKNGYDQVSTLDSIYEATNYLNFYNTQSWGVNISYTDNVFNWWQLNAVVNGAYINSDVLIPGMIAQNGSSWDISTSNTFVLNKSKTVLMLVNYWENFKSREGNSITNEMASLDFGIRCKFFNKKLQTSLTIRDVFKQLRNSGEIYFENNKQYYNNYYDSRKVTVGLTYNFGKKKSSKSIKSIDFNEKYRAQ